MENDMNEHGFLSDIQTIRDRARRHIEEGAVTESYAADRDTVLKLLNEALATEIVCVLRYRRHYFMAKGINSQSVAEEFLLHSNEEQGHADRIAERIVQLGGEPNFSPDGLTSRSHAEYVEAGSLIWPGFLRIAFSINLASPPESLSIGPLVAFIRGHSSSYGSSQAKAGGHAGAVASIGNIHLWLDMALRKSDTYRHIS
jgi:hypothetical protein